MTAEDEEFNRIEREASMRMAAVKAAVNTLRPCRSPYCECDVGKCSHPGCYDARGEAAAELEMAWETVEVIGLKELVNALDYADRKGFMPDAIRSEWEAFNYKAKRAWQGITLEDKQQILAKDFGGSRADCIDAADRILKEKNT